MPCQMYVDDEIKRIKFECSYTYFICFIVPASDHAQMGVPVMRVDITGAKFQRALETLLRAVQSQS